MRGKGEGSIYRRADGYWVGSVEVGRSPTGSRRRVRVVRKRRADVVAALDDLRRRAKGGGVEGDRTSVQSFLEFWLTDVVAGQVSESSRIEYEKRVRRMLPVIGHMRLSQLSVSHVQVLARALFREYSPNTARTTLDTLRTSLRWAVGVELIARNPAEHVSISRVVTVKVDDALTSEEARAVLATAKGDDLEVLWWLALKYGMRLGELLGLEWGDVDFASRELHVRKAKTPSGVRTLPLLDEAVRQLELHQQKATRGSQRAPVLLGPTGKALTEYQARDGWNRLLGAAGVEHRCRGCGTGGGCSSSIRRFHSSRHTAATLLLENGVPLEVVSAILGHSSIGITANIYAKVRGDLKRKGLEAVEGS